MLPRNHPDRIHVAFDVKAIASNFGERQNPGKPEFGWSRVA